MKMISVTDGRTDGRTDNLRRQQQRSLHYVHRAEIDRETELVVKKNSEFSLQHFFDLW